MKVVFPFLAQAHQMLHCLPIAAELALRWPAIEVHLACANDAQQALAHKLAALYPDAPLHYRRLHVNALLRLAMHSTGQALPPKLPLLWFNRGFFSCFDAAVVPERTSLFLKRHARHLKLIWTSHGAGDRAIGYAADLKKFDFALLAGRKQEQRMLAEGTLVPGRYAVGCYAKFDLVRKLAQTRAPLFDNGRPTVLYSPHFRRQFSSWPIDGFRVLDYFAVQRDYNLVFAPHLRLFDPPTARNYRPFARYQSLPHMKIDLGSLSSIDMSYTLGADIYLGDVSSQVTEFMIRPRPCVFLNSHRADWQDSPDYLFWKLGPVIDRPDQLGEALQRAASDPHWREAQAAYRRDSFAIPPEQPSAALGADAIARFLLGI